MPSNNNNSGAGPASMEEDNNYAYANSMNLPIQYIDDSYIKPYEDWIKNQIDDNLLIELREYTKKTYNRLTHIKEPITYSGIDYTYAITDLHKSMSYIDDLYRDMMVNINVLNPTTIPIDDAYLNSGLSPDSHIIFIDGTNISQSESVLGKLESCLDIVTANLSSNSTRLSIKRKLSHETIATEIKNYIKIYPKNKTLKIISIIMLLDMFYQSENLPIKIVITMHNDILKTLKDEYDKLINAINTQLATTNKKSLTKLTKIGNKIFQNSILGQAEVILHRYKGVNFIDTGNLVPSKDKENHLYILEVNQLTYPTTSLHGYTYPFEVKKELDDYLLYYLLLKTGSMIPTHKLFIYAHDNYNWVDTIDRSVFEFYRSIIDITYHTDTFNVQMLSGTKNVRKSPIDFIECKTSQPQRTPKSRNSLRRISGFAKSPDKPDFSGQPFATGTISQQTGLYTSPKRRRNSRTEASKTKSTPVMDPKMIARLKRFANPPSQTGGSQNIKRMSKKQQNRHKLSKKTKRMSKKSMKLKKSMK